MIPLKFAEKEKELIVKKVGGNDEVKRHLENLGVVPGSIVTVITELNGNLIVKVKESRIAINEELAKRIMI
ncbi:MAG: ferrous iron transport protein A [Spirochaetales bacterium]|nr:ferrous iron transport protein A [Spirochaetales bacterium]MBQ3923272.1 ferrous iron transport protein A [Spirochaetales bacterium]